MKVFLVCDREIVRGGIYFIYPQVNEEFGVVINIKSGRPAIVISNNSLNKGDVVEVIYLTTKPKVISPTHIPITSSTKQSYALCEQIDSIDKRRVGDCIGNCTYEEIRQINIAIATSLGISTKYADKFLGKQMKVKNEFPEFKSYQKIDELNVELEKTRVDRDMFKRLYEQLFHKCFQNTEVDYR